jgi:predicted DNA binding CopG/RHH family protein
VSLGSHNFDRARIGRVLESQMKKEYDFSKSRKNPCAKQLKSQITIRLDTAAVAYFKQMAAELGMPYQNLINLFLERLRPAENVGPAFNGRRTPRRNALSRSESPAQKQWARLFMRYIVALSSRGFTTTCRLVIATLGQ